MPQRLFSDKDDNNYNCLILRKCHISCTKYQRIPLPFYVLVGFLALIPLLKHISPYLLRTDVPFDLVDNKTTLNLSVRFIIEPRIRNQLDLLVMVNSIPNQYRERQEIRNSWADKALYDDQTTKIIFIIGRPASLNEEEHLAIEEGNHHDIVVVDIVEDYYSLSLKTYAMLYYKETRYPSTKCLVKADSDNVLIIRNYENLCVETIAPRILGKCDVDTRVIRNRTKWAVPESVYPLSEYPMYCSTGTYVLCGHDVPARLIKAVEESWFPHSANFRKLPEDVIFSGIMAEKAGIRRKHIGGMSFIDAPEFLCRDRTQTYSLHMNRIRDPLRYWKILLSGEGKQCSWF